ncbi:hypothetical protein CYMTET_52507 [Cymbomonas tetramitiformis]|uniref:Integrase zinc-binding domain-containing protein n=1 Tax=Cymbomonas tetramitiformis TaxID=36881 RepID=A0AAE0BIV8_9CHLO|nr:hypothetical protein CYMTET_52507 [Cymbomonas tetramitiformis]
MCQGAHWWCRTPRLANRSTCRPLRDRDGLKEAGYVDLSTDQPVTAEEGRRAAGAKGKPAGVPKVEAEVNAAVKEKEVEKEDPISPLDAGFSPSEEEDEEHPPVNPPVVTGKLAQLNGLWWAETPELWRDAMNTVAKMSAISAFAGVTSTRAQRAAAVEQPATAEQQSTAAEQQQPAAAAVAEQQPAATAAKQQHPAVTAAERQQSSPRIRPGEPLVDNQDWKLISSEFARLQSKYARVLGDPDVSIDDILRHYASEARQDPRHTAALFLVPDFPQASWRPLLREFGMEIVEIIPRTDEHGHTGRDKTLDRVRRRFWWPRMDLDVAEWVKTSVEQQFQRQFTQGLRGGDSRYPAEVASHMMEDILH